MSDRPITGHATYRGDQRSILLAGAKGPTYNGELLWPVTADYDEASNTTRIGFSHVPPTERTSS